MQLPALVFVRESQSFFDLGQGALLPASLVLWVVLQLVLNSPARPYPFRALLKEIGNDLRRYCYRLGFGRAQVILTSPGFQALCVYRLSHWLLPVTRNKSGWHRLVAMLVVLLRRQTEIVTGICIDPRAEIGPGMVMVHFGNIFIGPAKIGANCDIFQDVTVGVKNNLDLRVPTLGDRVYLAPGSKVLGDITLGDDVLVGPNSVLLTSVPDRAVVLGVPARIMSRTGSFEHVLYPGMEFDVERQHSLTMMLEENHIATMDQLAHRVSQSDMMTGGGT